MTQHKKPQHRYIGKKANSPSTSPSQLASIGFAAKHAPTIRRNTPIQKRAEYLHYRLAQSLTIGGPVRGTGFVVGEGPAVCPAGPPPRVGGWTCGWVCVCEGGCGVCMSVFCTGWTTCSSRMPLLCTTQRLSNDRVVGVLMD